MLNTARPLTSDPSPRLLLALSLPLLVALMLAYAGSTLAGDPQVETDLPDMQSIDVLVEEPVVVETIASEEVVIKSTEVEDRLLPPYDPANPQMPLMESSEAELDEESIIPSQPESGVSTE